MAENNDRVPAYSNDNMNRHMRLTDAQFGKILQDNNTKIGDN